MSFERAAFFAMTPIAAMAVAVAGGLAAYEESRIGELNRELRQAKAANVDLLSSLAKLANRLEPAPPPHRPGSAGQIGDAHPPR